MNSKGMLVSVVVLVVIVLGALFFFMRQPAATQTAQAPAVTNAMPEAAMATNTPAAPAAGTVTSTSTSTTMANMPKGVTITYTNSGFSPATVSVAAGQKVTFVNESSERMWVASDEHPIHTGYDGTSVMQHCANKAPTGTNVFDECTAVAKGGSFTFMPLKTGSWNYHNHANDSRTGTLTVTAAPVTTTTTTTTVHATTGI